ncbi:MAG TPA: pyridoxamine 5'-phosphate oxidase family protein [Blastocatellia bacterium]|nr:pyridoxamine 5'-phosphate oxidase family protein [Blastocatellia bacterium]
MQISSFSEIESEFIARVHSMVWCSFATVDTRNRVRSRVLHTIWEGATGWAATRPDSLKARHIAHNPYVSLAYVSDVYKPVYADCTAEWVDDLSAKQRIWDMFTAAPPPLGYDLKAFFSGVDSPGFGLLKLTPWRIELFDITNPDNYRRVWRP